MIWSLGIPPPLFNPDNLVDMKEDNDQGEGKCQQHKSGKDVYNGKWWRREGIKRNLQDIPCQSYEECENDRDELDQSKRCRRGIYCLLEGCSHDVDKNPEERDNQPISKLAFQGEPVQQIPYMSAAPCHQAKQAEWGRRRESAVDSTRQDRLSDVGRYSLVQ